MSHVTDFDAIVDELPSDWSLLVIYIALEDALQLGEARIALARTNPRPLFGPGDHDFAITVARVQGRGSAVGVVRSALAMLDDLGIGARMWPGTATSVQRPAPAHRYGP